MRCEVLSIDICVTAVRAVDQPTRKGDWRIHVAVCSERYMLVFGKFDFAAFICAFKPRTAYLRWRHIPPHIRIHANKSIPRV